MQKQTSIGNEPHWYYEIHKEYSKDSDLEHQISLELEKIQFREEEHFIFSHYNYSGPRSLFKKIFKFVEAAIEENSFVLMSSLYINSYEIFDLLAKAAEQLPGK